MASPAEEPQDFGEGSTLCGNGAILFRKASDFFFWCMSKETPNSSDRTLYQKLSCIMQICKFSATSGDFIEDHVERKTADLLTDLRDALQSGTMKRSEIVNSLDQVIFLLTDESPKAKLVLTLHLLEQKFFPTRKERSEGKHKQFTHSASKLLAKLKRGTPNIHAEAIGRDLKRFIHDEHTLEDLFVEMELCEKRWLS